MPQGGSEGGENLGGGGAGAGQNEVSVFSSSSSIDNDVLSFFFPFSFSLSFFFLLSVFLVARPCPLEHTRTLPCPCLLSTALTLSLPPPCFISCFFSSPFFFFLVSRLPSPFPSPFPYLKVEDGGGGGGDGGSVVKNYVLQFVGRGENGEILTEFESLGFVTARQAREASITGMIALLERTGGRGGVFLIQTVCEITHKRSVHQVEMNGDRIYFNEDELTIIADKYKQWLSEQ